MPKPHPSCARLRLEELEDRTTPAGSQIPAGEFNWTQISPQGELTQLIWDGSALVYRVQHGSSWQSEVVAVENGIFTRSQYDDQRQLQSASQSAQLVFSTDGTPHVFYLSRQWVPTANGYQTQIVHLARTGSSWRHLETIVTPWVGKWGPNNLVAASGPNNSISLVFTETYEAATGAGRPGTGALWYATNQTGRWTFEKIADTVDLTQDNWFVGGRIAPRWLALAIDSQGAAHVTYTPGFFVQGAFSRAWSELRYATNMGGSWRTELVYSPPDGTGDAALGASIAVAPNGQVAIAGYFVDRYDTGSPASAQLHYYTPKIGGGWNVQVVTRMPDGYVGGDGAKYTGFSPQLFFDAQGQANILFSDVAAQHLPVTYANEFSGQIRLATLTPNGWTLTTLYRQSNPLTEGMYYPLAVPYQNSLFVVGVKSSNSLDSNQNVARMDFSLVGMNTSVVSPPPPAMSPPPTPRTTASPPPPAPAAPSASGNAGSHPSPPPSPEKLAYAVGADAGARPVVALYSTSNTLLGHITPFDASYRGGVRVATADVNGDGYEDVICGSGPGDPSRVQVWDGRSRTLLFDVIPFDGFRGGVHVAAGDINNDGRADIVIVPDAGGGPRVQVWSGRTLEKLTPDFFGIDNPGLSSGLRVAVGDINRDGYADLAVVPGRGAAPRVAVFDGRSFLPHRPPLRMLNDFYVIDPRLTTGVFLTIGDITGDGFAEVIASADRGGGPRVQAIDGRQLLNQRSVVVADYFVGDVNSRTGVRLATTQLDGQAAQSVIVGTGAGGGSRVFVIHATSYSPSMWFDAFASFAGGVYVG